MSRPFSRWPIAWHLGLAGLAVLAVAFLSTAAVRWAGTQELLARDALTIAQARASRSVTKPAPQKAADLTLPPRRTAESVVRDISRLAADLPVQVNSVSLSDHEGGGGEAARVVMTLQALADYSAFKRLLAELLARYPALSIQSLSLRAPDGRQDARIESHAVLVLYVRDGR